MGRPTSAGAAHSGSHAFPAPRWLPLRTLSCAAAFTLLTGCATSGVPDPRAAANAYADAAARGDAGALRRMLSEASRQALSPAQVEQLVNEEKPELAEQARALSQPDARVEATARMRFADGEEAALELREGRYWVSAAGALPGGGRTPEEALSQLRRVLARRSYAGLMRVLSPGTRASIENDLRSLVEGLDRPDTLPVHLNGESAVVTVPGGHQVKLKREDGVWRVDDFD